MAYIGKQPAAAVLAASDITAGIISTAKIADTAITNAKLNADIISADTALAVAPADTDEFLVSDAGVLKRLDYSLIKGGGKVLQLVTATDTTSRTVASTSYTKASNTLDVTITPSATSSKVLVILGGTHNFANGRIEFHRAGSSVAEGFQVSTSASGTMLMFIDSPSTTSAIEYEVYGKALTGVGYFNELAAGGTLYCFEIGA